MHAVDDGSDGSSEDVQRSQTASPVSVDHRPVKAMPISRTEQDSAYVYWKDTKEIELLSMTNAVPRCLRVISPMAYKKVDTFEFAFRAA